MPRTKTRPKRTTKMKSAGAPNGVVLTLAEVAAYLRMPEAKIELLVREHNLPGRSLGDDWRFLKSAVDDWLQGMPVRTSDFWDTQAGAFRDDPQLDEIVREAYRRRGRPITDSEPQKAAG